MTNYGARAILVLELKRRRKVPTPDEVDLRWLIAVETFPADASGWRFVGADKLASAAGLRPHTSRRARDRLVADGLVEYRRGNGYGRLSSYRLLFKMPPPAETDRKVSTQAGHLVEKVSTQAGHLSDVKRCPADPEKVSTWPEKGVQQNPSISANANGGLKAFGLDTSGLEASEILPPNRRAKNQAPAALDEYLDRFKKKLPAAHRPAAVPRPAQAANGSARRDGETFDDYRSRMQDELMQLARDHPEPVSREEDQ